MKKDIEKKVATNTDRIIRLEEQGKHIVEALTRVEESAVVLRHIIEGNGNPGLKTDMQLLKQSVATIHETLVESAKKNFEAIEKKKDHLWHWWTAIGILVLTEVTRLLLHR